MTEDQIALRHFEATQKALHRLVGLFVVGHLKKHLTHPEVRNAISTLAQIAKDRQEPQQ